VTTARVLDGMSIRLVVHYSDDDSWAFLDGETFDLSRGKVIGMGEALKLDPSLAEVADLPPGWTASRTHVGGPWSRTPDADV
jgi:hypothetical protein